MAKNVYSERFLEVIEKMGLTLYEVGKKVDALTNTQAYQIASGKAGASLSIISSFMEAYPNVNGNYILTGKGPMFILDRDADTVKKEADMDFNKNSRNEQKDREFYEDTILNMFERILQEIQKSDNNIKKTIEENLLSLSKSKIDKSA